MGAIFRSFEKYADVLVPDTLVLEIGTARQGDDNSTIVISELAQRHGCDFVTVDVDDKHLQSAIDAGISTYNMTGERFCKEVLPKLNKKVSMVYLDNFDWDWNPPKEEPWIKEQQELYKTKYGMEMTNVASQVAHVTQTMLLLPYLTDNCAIAFDDTFYMPHLGHYTGKGAAAVPLLLGLGFEIVEEYENPVYGLMLRRYT